MLNHFRSLLLNISDTGDPTEFIAPGFINRTLPTVFLSIYNTLFPTTDREQIKLFGQAYLNIIQGANIKEVFTLIDPRISYIEDDFKNFMVSNSQLLTIILTFKKQNQIISNMMKIKAGIDTTKYDNLWIQHPNDLYKLAGLLSAYTLRLK